MGWGCSRRGGFRFGDPGGQETPPRYEQLSVCEQEENRATSLILLTFLNISIIHYDSCKFIFVIICRLYCTGLLQL